jgi:hypothetical protein
MRGWGVDSFEENLKKMRNRFILLIVLSLFLLFGCGLNKNFLIDNRLHSCLSQDNIDLLIRTKKRKGNLYITEVAFNFEECVGLFRYEFAESRRSAGVSNYVLKSKDDLFFQSQETNENRKIVSVFMSKYGDFFSDFEKKYIFSLFSEIGATRGKFSQM